MKKIIPATFLLFICFSARSQDKSKAIITDKFQPATSATLTGFIGNKIDLSYDNRIMKQDVNRLTDVFKQQTETWCWQSEFWGKWFTSAVLAYKYKPTPELKTLLDKSVQQLIAAQKADGYLGNYVDEKRLDGWDIWGRKYCMLGLLNYYDLTNDKNSLAAAKKICDHLIKELADKNAVLVKKGSHRGMAASSVLEPVVLLYTRTKDAKYLSFAESIVAQWETNDGPQLISKADIPVGQRFPKPKNWFGWEQGQKAYEMMSCYEGLLELYRVTGKKQYLDAVLQTWKSIVETEINVAGSGAAAECWFGGKALQTVPITHYQETCVTATWIKLNQQLLRLTGEPKYADQIELTFYNALLGSMSNDGSDWSKYTPLNGKRLQGGEQCGMGINCCVASGPRGLFTIPSTALMRNNAGAAINFYIPGTITSTTPSRKTFSIVTSTDYPVSGNVSATLKMGEPENMELSVRIPAWSKKSIVLINGDTLKNVMAGTQTGISRLWRNGDRVEIIFDMRARVEYGGDAPQQTCIMKGPVLLARDARLGTVQVDDVIVPVTDKDGYFPLTLKTSNEKDWWMQWQGEFLVESSNANQPVKVPIVLCDYSSAGKTYDERSWFRSWLPQAIHPEK